MTDLGATFPLFDCSNFSIAWPISVPHFNIVDNMTDRSQCRHFPIVWLITVPLFLYHSATLHHCLHRDVCSLVYQTSTFANCFAANSYIPQVRGKYSYQAQGTTQSPSTHFHYISTKCQNCSGKSDWTWSWTITESCPGKSAQLSKAHCSFALYHSFIANIIYWWDIIHFLTFLLCQLILCACCFILLVAGSTFQTI